MVLRDRPGICAGDGPQRKGELASTTFAKKIGVSYSTIVRWTRIADAGEGPLAGCVRRSWAGRIWINVADYEARQAAIKGPGGVEIGDARELAVRVARGEIPPPRRLR